MNNPNGANGQPHHQQHPFHPQYPPQQQQQQYLDHRYMGGYFVGHPQQHQTPTPYYPGANRQSVGGHVPPPPPQSLMNSQYPNTFLMNCYQGLAANGWTGVPLISTAKRRPPRKATNGAFNNNNNKTAIEAKDFNQSGSSMSKMALHAHGAPLILSHSSNNNNNSSVVVPGVLQGPRHGNGPVNRLQPLPSTTMRYRNKSNQNAQPMHRQLNGGHNHQHQHHRVAMENSLLCDRGTHQFVTDENSSILSNSSTDSSPGSSNSSGIVSDACLPRIIKPRKRRKKERKPGHLSGDPQEENDNTENHHYHLKTGSEEDFEDDEAVMTCSCHLCDPHSHIWSFPLRRGRLCSLENEDDHFPDRNNAGIDLYPAVGKNHKYQQRAKDVGVIGGDRVKQQRNEWRGSQQYLSECDNDLLNAKMDNMMMSNQQQQQQDSVMGTSRGGVFVDRWPPMLEGIGKSGEDPFLCASRESAGSDALLLLQKPPRDTYCGLSVGRGGGGSDEDEELLIENLANLLCVQSPSKDHTSGCALTRSSSDSTSSGVSSASDSGSVFGECYSPLVNLGSPPSFAFNFPPSMQTGGIFPIAADKSGLMNGDQQTTIKQLLITATDVRGAAEREEHDAKDHQHKQHALSCLDMDWYRAATTNRRLLMPYINN